MFCIKINNEIVTGRGNLPVLFRHWSSAISYMYYSLDYKSTDKVSVELYNANDN